mmetsp:Transcript_23047/g.71804  ORF Transcript_23047/g.71804 Transcript_23047/m.71804 type:complete len:313 (-) Transcript_23047:1305-2243(-)
MMRFSLALAALSALCRLSHRAAVHGFDLQEAQADATYASYAYCDWEQYEELAWGGKTEGFIVDKVMYEEAHELQGFVGVNPDQKSIIVAFQGTNHARNWITNLYYYKVDYPHCEGCQVHDGFYQGTQAVYDTVYSAVSELKQANPDFEIRVTGHSLGGALALLTSLELANDGFDVVHRSFGAPRTGNEEYAAYADGRLALSLRFTHLSDLVPHVPAVAMGFYHTAEEIWEAGDAYYECDGSGEDPKCSNSVSPFYSVSDHVSISPPPPSPDLKPTSPSHLPTFFLAPLVRLPRHGHHGAAMRDALWYLRSDA